MAAGSVKTCVQPVFHGPFEPVTGPSPRNRLATGEHLPPTGLTPVDVGQYQRREGTAGQSHEAP